MSRRPTCINVHQCASMRSTCHDSHSSSSAHAMCTGSPDKCPGRIRACSGQPSVMTSRYVRGAGPLPAIEHHIHQALKPSLVPEAAQSQSNNPGPVPSRGKTFGRLASSFRRCAASARGGHEILSSTSNYMCASAVETNSDLCFKLTTTPRQGAACEVSVLEGGEIPSVTERFMLNATLACELGPALQVVSFRHT